MKSRKEFVHISFVCKKKRGLLRHYVIIDNLERAWQNGRKLHLCFVNANESVN